MTLNFKCCSETIIEVQQLNRIHSSKATLTRWRVKSTLISVNVIMNRLTFTKSKRARPTLSLSLSQSSHLSTSIGLIPGTFVRIAIQIASEASFFPFEGFISNKVACPFKKNESEKCAALWRPPFARRSLRLFALEAGCSVCGKAEAAMLQTWLYMYMFLCLDLIALRGFIFFRLSFCCVS